MTKETIETTSIDIEKLILGSMLANEENANIGLKCINEDDFHENKHKIIFKTILRFFSEEKPIDTFLIANHVDQITEKKEALPYLINIQQQAGTSCHIEAYCEDLRKLTLRRQLVNLGNSLSTDLKQGADESKIIEKLKEKIGNIEKNKSQADSSYRYLLENNSEKSLIEEIKTISEGVFTGFKIGDLDLIIPGGAITIIAAPTSHGKTTALINFSLGVLNHHYNKKIVFFTYEESASAILCLFINTWLNRDLSKNNRESIKSHFFNENVEHIKQEMRSDFLRDKKAFFDHVIDKGKLKVFYSDMSAEELVQAIHFIKKNDPNIGMICIDYMQFLKLLKRPQGSRQEELKEICLMLKDCAIDTGLPILIAAQFSRQVVAEADLSPIQIGEAGDIERAANMIIGMWNRNFEFSRLGNIGKNGKKIDKESTIYFEILKGRGIGAGHSCVMDFNGYTGKISNQLNSSKTNYNVSF